MTEIQLSLRLTRLILDKIKDSEIRNKLSNSKENIRVRFLSIDRFGSETSSRKYVIRQ